MRIRTSNSFPFVYLERGTAVQHADAAAFKKKTPGRRLAHANLTYNASDNKDSYKSSAYDLHTVAMVYDSDSYARRAVDRFTDLIWKNGWSFIGDNPKAVKYVQDRFDQMQYITDQCTQELFDQIAMNAILYSNVFIYKARSTAASGGNTYETMYGLHRMPVAGLFVLDTPNMWISKESNGRVLGYKLIIDGKSEEYKPREIHHMPFNRKAGMTFGTPMMIPIISDIEALRKMEENVEILVFQYAIPMMQYIVGNEENPPEPEDITQAQYEIEDKPANGVFVHDYRNKIESIDVRGANASDISRYLDHFKNRIYAGFSMSASGYGESSRESRGSSDKKELGLQDTVRRYQTNIKRHMDLIIREIEAEGGYRYTDDNPRDKVELFVGEIDLDAKIKKDNHYMESFNNNAITHPELRKELGRDPMEKSGYGETKYHLFPGKEALAAMGLLPAGGSSDSGSKSVANKNRPANQYGRSLVKPLTPLRNAQEFAASLSYTIKATADDMSKMTEDNIQLADNKELRAVITTSSNILYDKFREIMGKAYRDGLAGCPEIPEDLWGIEQAGSRYTDSLLDSVKKLALKSEGGQRFNAATACEALSPGLNLLSNLCITKAYNLGVARCLLKAGEQVAQVVHPDSTACPDSAVEEMELKTDILSYSNMLPGSGKCTCLLTKVEKK